MKIRCAFRHAGRRDAGYALLMVVFLVSVMLITAVAAAPRILTQGRREKEEELAWRGEQYVRAVRLYYRKNGRFPQSVEDLTKAKNELRFLRKAYTDPMNSADGSWRMLYVLPNGQIIGSTKHHTPLQMPGTADQQTARQRARPPARRLPDSQQPAAGSQGPDQPAPGGTPGTDTTAGTPGQPTTPEPAPTDLGPEGKVFGGNIIGVGSKINRPSFRVYDGATVYREWEFIWDPAKDALGVAGRPNPPAGTPNPPPQQQQQQQQKQQNPPNPQP